MKKFESEWNTPFSAIFGHTLNVILGFIPRIHAGHLLNVILGLVPRIHAKHSPLLDTRVTPEYDNRKNFTKGLDVVRQCAALLERLKTHIKIHPLFCHPRAWLLDRPEDLDSRVKPENDYKVMQCGRSMIEMLGVLAIIGVLSVGGIAGYSKAMMKFKINKTMQQIAEIATNVRTLYAQQKDFNGLNTSLAINMGVVPEELISGTTAINAFNGHVYINSDTYGINRTDKPPYFSIKFIELPPEACIALATADWGSISSSGVLGIMAGYLSAYGDSASDYLVYFDGALIENCTEGYGLGNNYGNGYESYYVCSGHLPMSPTKAAYACKSGGMEKGFGIKFTK